VRWKLEVGSWKVEGGRWKLEVGSWKLEGGRWKLEGGRWKVEGGQVMKEFFASNKKKIIDLGRISFQFLYQSF
jgi:hypothetical protein